MVASHLFFPWPLLPLCISIRGHARGRPVSKVGRQIPFSSHVIDLESAVFAYHVNLCFLGSNSALQCLSERARWHLKGAQRPSTQVQYDRSFLDFIAFAVFLNIRRYDDLQFLLCYFTYLYESGVTVSTLHNITSALRFNFIMHSLNFQVFEHPKIKLLLKSFLINRPAKFRAKNIITIECLRQISRYCDTLSVPILFRAIFMFAFFSFLRISHFAANSKQKFDTSRQLTRADVIWADPGAHIVVRWAKNLQDRASFKVIQIPFLKDKSVCPVTALYAYISKFPLPVHSPLFAYPKFNTPLCQSAIRKALSKINTAMGLDPHYFTFHAFRRSGATLAFDNNVQLQHIQAHGGWRTSAVWSYLAKSQLAEVPRAFQSLFS